MARDPEQPPADSPRPDEEEMRPGYDPTESEPVTGETGAERPDFDHTTTQRQVTAQEAANVLGITVEAVRARMRRGTLGKEKAPNGTVYVRLPADYAGPANDRTAERRREGVARTPREDRLIDPSRPDVALIEALRDQIEVLRSELEDRKEEARRKDAIIMSLSRGVPGLPSAASQERPNAPETGAPEKGEVSRTGEAQEGQEEAPRRRSWFVRFFFGP